MTHKNAPEFPDIAEVQVITNMGVDEPAQERHSTEANAQKASPDVQGRAETLPTDTGPTETPTETPIETSGVEWDFHLGWESINPPFHVSSVILRLLAFLL